MVEWRNVWNVERRTEDKMQKDLKMERRYISFKSKWQAVAQKAASRPNSLAFVDVGQFEMWVALTEGKKSGCLHVLP